MDLLGFVIPSSLSLKPFLRRIQRDGNCLDRVDAALAVPTSDDDSEDEDSSGEGSGFS